MLVQVTNYTWLIRISILKRNLNQNSNVKLKKVDIMIKVLHRLSTSESSESKKNSLLFFFDQYYYSSVYYGYFL